MGKRNPILLVDGGEAWQRRVTLALFGVGEIEVVRTAADAVAWCLCGEPRLVITGPDLPAKERDDLLATLTCFASSSGRILATRLGRLAADLSVVNRGLAHQALSPDAPAEEIREMATRVLAHAEASGAQGRAQLVTSDEAGS